MKQGTEIIADENDIEILVGYNYDKTPPYYEEPGNAMTLVDAEVFTELTSIEIVIAGRGIDILSLLTEKEKDFIISKLNYE